MRVEGSLHSDSDRETLITAIPGSLRRHSPKGKLKFDLMDQEHFRRLLQPNPSGESAEGEATSLIASIRRAFLASNPRSRPGAHGKPGGTATVRRSSGRTRKPDSLVCQGLSRAEHKAFRHAMR